MSIGSATPSTIFESFTGHLVSLILTPSPFFSLFHIEILIKLSAMVLFVFSQSRFNLLGFEIKSASVGLSYLSDDRLSIFHIPNNLVHPLFQIQKFCQVRGTGYSSIVIVFDWIAYLYHSIQY